MEVCVGGRRRSTSRDTKREAQAWAAEQEMELRRELVGDVPVRPFRDLLERYEREVTPTKRGHVRESKMIALICRDPVADVPLRELAPRHIADWRDRRLRSVSGSTVDREMNILSNACSVARREWGWLMVNPVSDVRRPKSNPARTRRPTDRETELLLHALGYSKDEAPETISARVAMAYLFAMETAMRAGEICGLRWPDVGDRHVHIPKTKNGHARDVPLSAEARRLLDQLRPVTGQAGSVFEVSSASLDALFRKARARSLIEDLTFHDTRREALTRLSRVYDVMELARISGHRDLRILQNVYYAPSIEDLADKLD